MSFKTFNYLIVLILCAIIFALPGFAQQPPQSQQPSDLGCKLTLESTLSMQGLYGRGKISLYAGRVECKNYSQGFVQIGGVDIDLSLPTVNTISAADARALLTRNYLNQPGQRATRDLNSAMGVLGAVAASTTSIGVGPLGWTMMGVSAVNQYIIPLFTANQPLLTDLFAAQPCDSVQPQTLQPGQTMTCILYVQKPPKGAAPMASAMTFYLGVVAPIPAGAPTAPPILMLRPRAMGMTPQAQPQPQAVPEAPLLAPALVIPASYTRMVRCGAWCDTQVDAPVQSPIEVDTRDPQEIIASAVQHRMDVLVSMRELVLAQK